MVVLVASLVTLNGLLWLLALSAAHRHTVILATCMAAYLFGLRHAVDADHISAIDNTTRRLMQLGQKPIGVGAFFSLGHSTIVVLLCAGLSVATGYVQHHLHHWQDIGGVIGTLISTFFLYVIGAINVIAFWGLARAYRLHRAGCADTQDGIVQGPQGPFAYLLRPLLKMITHSWQMYFIGLLFGLGFDTATEVGILAISAKSSQAGLAFGTLMLLPALFTAGMCLVDTLDGILMLRAYGWATLQPARRLGYNLLMTAISVAVAFVVGTQELLQVLTSQGHLRAHFAVWIGNLDFSRVGFGIIGVFTLIWGLSVLWNRRPARAEEQPS